MALWCVAWKLIAAAMREKTKATGIYYPTVQSSAILICWWWWLLCSIWRQVLHVILDLFFARFIFDCTNSSDHLYKRKASIYGEIFIASHVFSVTPLKRIAKKNDNARSNKLGNGNMKHWALEFVFKSHLHILWLHVLSLPFKGNIHRG